MPPAPGAITLTAHALLLGDRIGGGLPDWPRLASAPSFFAAPGGGSAAVFRYGALVLFGVSAEDATALRSALEVRNPLPQPVEERIEIRLVGQGPGSIENGVIELPDLACERLQAIALALAKSVALERFERESAAGFDRIEPLAAELRSMGRPGRSTRALVSHIGEALLAEHNMVGRFEVREKPELLWEHPELERFYARLSEEFDLEQRALELERKLELLSRTARTALGLMQNARNLRVEWYIVSLIVVEIALLLYDMAR